MKKGIRINTYAFTLVELIVVIAILAILATIAFVTLQGYAREARNSSRASDLATIRSGLSFFSTTNSYYPIPDNFEAVTHSGEILWRQGSFGFGVRSEMKKISTDIVDPLLGNEIDYSLLASRAEYQVAAAYELIADASIPGVESTYAYDDENFSTYVEGTYDSYDVIVRSGTGCQLVTAPSLILTQIPSGGELDLGSSYNFSYKNSPNIPKLAYEKLNSTFGGKPFVISEVYNECSIDSIADVDLYIAELSTAFQQYADASLFENIVFTSETQAFRLRTVLQMEESGIMVPDSLKKILKSPLPDNVFADIFTDVDSTFLTSHTSGSGSWAMWSGTDSTYEISSNGLEKTDNSTASVYPIPNPSISSSGSTLNFDIIDFSGGSIFGYLRHTDDDNHYGFEIDSGGYRLFQKVAGVETNLASINESIGLPVDVSFFARGNNVNLTLNGIEKENIFVNSISAVGKPVIYIENSTARIDNFSLSYK